MFEQLTLFPAEDDFFLTSVDKFEVQFQDRKASLTKPETITDKKIKSVSDSSRYGVSDTFKRASLTINKYSPAKRKTEYFRLSYRIGAKVKHVHIRGGNVNSKLAQNRVFELQNAINRGASIQELLTVIANYPHSM